MGFTPENIKKGDHTMGAVSTNIHVMRHNPYMKPTVMLCIELRKVHKQTGSTPQYCFSFQEDVGCILFTEGSAQDSTDNEAGECVCVCEVLSYIHNIHSFTTQGCCIPSNTAQSQLQCKEPLRFSKVD